MADNWDQLIDQYRGGGSAPPAPPAGGDHWDELIRQHAPAKQPGMRAAAQFDGFVPATPEEKQLAGELRSKADRELLDSAGGAAASPWYAAAESFGNTLGLNIPRNVAAAARTRKTGNSFEHEYDFLKRVDAAAERQSPATANVYRAMGAIGGAAAVPMAPAASIGGRALQGAALGAGQAGLGELADTKDVGQAARAAAIGGALGGVAAPVAEKLLSAPVNAVARSVALRAAAPTKEELKAAGQAAYQRADNAGVILNPGGVHRLNSEMQSMLAESGYHPALQPKLAVAVAELDKLTQGNVTLKGLDLLRRIAGAARSDADPSTRKFGGDFVGKVDDFLESLRPSDILTGKSNEAVKALKEARDSWRSYRKADLIDTALESAQLRAASTGSGGNIDNAIRQEFRKLLTNSKTATGFSVAEKSALARVVTGTKSQNVLRLLGKLSPQGDGLRLMLSLGAAGASGGASLPVSAIGAGAKALADRATPANVERLSELVRSGGKLPAGRDLVDEEGRSALRKFFTSLGVNVEDLARRERE